MLLNLPRQLPTYDGTKSYQNLLVEVYGIDMDTDKKDLFIQLKPINFIRSGEYSHLSGYSQNTSNRGMYHQGEVNTDTHSWSLFFFPTALTPRASFMNKGSGQSLRCLVR